MVRPELEAREAKPHNLWSDKRGEDDRHLKISPATAAEWPFSRVTILQLPAKGLGHSVSCEIFAISVCYRYIFTVSWV